MLDEDAGGKVALAPPVCERTGQPVVVKYFQTTDGQRLWESSNCDEPGDHQEVLTASRVARAFQSFELPASTLTVQPKGGRAVVNFPMVFFATTPGDLDRSMRLLGSRVDFRVSATGYEWQFGDGESMTTDWPGKPFTTFSRIGENITHRYMEMGTMQVRVDTTYGATFRVNGGAWRTVPGTVTIEGAEQALPVVEGVPTLG